MNKKRNGNNKGFSLIELIIAIAILIILTGLLAPQFMKYIEKSREAKDMQTLDTVYSSVQAAMANEEAYDKIIEATKADPYTVKIKLEDALKTPGDNNFYLELQSLIGKESPKLQSKKADAGFIYIGIKYTNSKVEIGTGNDKKEVETFGGFEIMVYSSEDGDYKDTDLDYIGADLRNDLKKVGEGV